MSSSANLFISVASLYRYRVARCQAGERTTEMAPPDHDFLKPAPNMDIHRTMLRYSDADIKDYWENASKFFNDLFGVDFVSAPVRSSLMDRAAVAHSLTFVVDMAGHG